MTNHDSRLTPAQSADVVNYYYIGENAISLEHNTRPKISLGKAAVHAASPHESILPSGTPLLSRLEATEGFLYAQERSAAAKVAQHLHVSEKPQPVPTPEEQVRIDRLTDTMNAYEAYAAVMGVWPSRY